MMMVLQVVATFCGNGMQLMIRQIFKCPTGGRQRVVELIVGVVHLIDTEHGLQAAFVKRLVVGHKWKTFYQRLYLCPHLGEHGRIIGIFAAETMNLTAPIVIIVRLRLDKRIERIYYLTAANNNNTYRANATALIISRFKIYCCKVLHYFLSKFICM